MPQRDMSLAAYNRTVASIFDAVLDERLTSAALEAMADYAGVSGASYLRVNKLTRQVSAVARWGCFDGPRAEYLAHYSKIDPFRVIPEQAPCGTLFRLSEALPQSVLRHDEWYNDYMLPGGVCDVLGSKLHESSSHIVLAGFHRAVDDADRFPGDMEALQALLDPLRNAARLNLGLIDIGYRSAIVNGELELIAAGAIFTDGDGHVVETNRVGEHILRTGDGLTIRDGRLCARRSFETAKLTHLIAKAVSPSCGAPCAGCILIARDDDRPAYVVRVAPVGTGIAGNDLPLAMILVSVPDEKRVSERELAELYGLSPAESRIAIALAHGKRLTDLAGEFGVQITTLRTQLSSILSKCEVERQSDLIRLILSIPIVPSALAKLETA